MVKTLNMLTDVLLTIAYMLIALFICYLIGRLILREYLKSDPIGTRTVSYTLLGLLISIVLGLTGFGIFTCLT
jgi:hypothetical protein